jgi:putative ABC transport system permease protein
MVTVETDIYMFGRELQWYSILIGAILTVVFSLIVNFVMYFKLKKIDMIESLKSVE